VSVKPEWAIRAQAALGSLLGDLGVTKVVFVDDQAYESEKVLVKQTQIPKLGAVIWDKIGEYADFVDAEWDGLDARARRDAHDRAIRKNPGLATRDLDVLGVLFPSTKFIAVDPQAWRDEGDELVPVAEVGETLVFFDLDLGVQGGPRGGAELLARYLDSYGEGKAVLLTREIPAEAELDVPPDLAQQLDRPEWEILIASKEHLTQDRVLEFVDYLRLSLTAPSLKAIRLGVRTALEGAHSTAVEQFNKMPLHAVQDIVVRTSRTEGIWEIDTYLRVFQILLRRALHGKVSENDNAELRAAISDARKAAELPAGDPAWSSKTIAELMAAENYSTGKVINEAGLPLENGDIFEIDGELLILAMQPCDLAFRDDGSGARKETRLARLLQIEQSEDWPRNPAKLPKGLYAATLGSSHGLEDPGCVAKLKPIRHLSLELLDLCCFDADGKAQLDLDRTPPPALVPGQAERYQELRKLVVSSSLSRRSSKAGGRIFLDTNGDVSVKSRWTPGARRIRFSVRRVARLSAPHSAQLLTAFAHDVSRAAYDPPLNRF
jgi:hypothetical protein